MTAPDVVGEGEVICPCGNYTASFHGHLADAVRAMTGYERPVGRRNCPKCNRILEVWPKP